MESWFRLRTPEDLLAKLKAEAELLRQHPEDSYLAFNFFVTAFHIIEWIHPGNSNKRLRKSLVDNEPLLQVLSHIANGTKHLEIDPDHHNAVKSTGGAPSWAEAPNFGRNLGKRVVNQKALFIRLQGGAAKRIGATISVTDLADKAVAFWENYLREL